MVLLISVILLIVNFSVTNVESKSEYVQPLTMGMQVAISYDIANIWNRPVSFSPFISTFLGMSLLFILFFGVITAPFGYMFGVPSQKYVMGTDGHGTDSLLSVLMTAAEEWNKFNNNSTNTNSTTGSSAASSRSFKTSLVRKVIQHEWQQPDFGESVLKFFPSALDAYPQCQQFILCQVHSTLRNNVSDSMLPVYRIFSKTLINLTWDHSRAIKLGLKGENCAIEFDECPSDMYSLVATTVLDLLPAWFRRSLIIPQM